MEAPDVYNLTRINWQVFGTLTFRSESLPNKVHQAMWFAHCRLTCASFGLYFPNALWCLRQERGEATGRRHFHYLFGGLPEKAVTESTCFAQMAQWERLGGGMARVRVFNHALNGVSYVTKCLSGVGADLYELNKFGWDKSEIRLSSGASAMLLRILREGTRRIERLDKRRSKSLSVSSVTNPVPWQDQAVKDSSMSVARESLAAADVLRPLNGARVTNGLDEIERDGCAGDCSHNCSPEIGERIAGQPGGSRLSIEETIEFLRRSRR